MNREGGLFHTNPFRGKLDDAGMIEIVRKTVLEDKPYKFAYSNIGMSILGYIVGQTSGEGFWDGLTRYIREDLGLRNTFLGNVDLPGYDKKDQPCRCWQWEKNDAIAPAGALNAPVEDLLDFTARNLDGSLPYLEVCHEVHGPCEKNANSGLAWRLEKDAPGLQRLAGPEPGDEKRRGRGGELWPGQRRADRLRRFEIALRV